MGWIAALPMYDWPERRAEVDAEWAAMRDALRARGFPAPEALTRSNSAMPPVPGGIRDASGTVIAPDPATLAPDGFDLAVLWRHPALLLAQTCWGPLETTGLAAWVRVVGQPDYEGFPGGRGRLYRSAVVMRRAGADVAPPSTSGAVLPVAALGGRRLAFNDPHSMSGRIALERDLAAIGAIAGEGGFDGFWSGSIVTGSHRASVRAVAAGAADVAAIDGRSWAYCRSHEAAAAELAVVGWTALRNGLPLVTAAGSPLDRL